MSKIGVGVTIAILLAGDMTIRYVDARQAHKTPDVVIAQEFRLVGKQGELRAKVGTNAKDETGVWIYDKAGKKAKAQLLVTANAGADLTLLDSAGRERVVLSLVELANSASMTSLRLIGGTGKGGMFLTTLSGKSKGASALSLYHDNNKQQALLGADEDNGGRLVLYDKEGKQVWPEP